MIVMIKKSNLNIALEWEKRAKRINVDVSKWVCGDALYEEVFGDIDFDKKNHKRINFNTSKTK